MDSIQSWTEEKRDAEIEACEGFSYRDLTFAVRPEESIKESITSFILNQIMKILREFGVPYGSRPRVAAVKEKGITVIQGNFAACIALYGI